MEALKRFKQWLSRHREPTSYAITVAADGFSVGPRRLDWAQISSIAAFKRDRVTFDEVWFQLEGAGEPVMVCEAQPGFDAWEAALQSHFPSVEGWRERVIQPPFAESFAVLYRHT